MGIFDKLIGKKTVSPTATRSKNNQFIKELGITCNEFLPYLDFSSAKLKDIGMRFL